MVQGLDLGFRFSMLLLAIVVQPSAHLCDTLQLADEWVFKSEGPMADI